MDATLNQLKKFAEEKGCLCFVDEPMKNHTTFKIGGSADLFLQPVDTSCIADLILQCNLLSVPYFILGNGSNILVSDKGIRGVVISTANACNAISLIDETTIRCGAGVRTSQLCQFALQHAIGGFEFLWGIPGTIGGALFMNAGAYGGEMKDIVCNAEHIDASGNIATFKKDQLELGYRSSVYQTCPCVITTVVLKGQKADQQTIKNRMDALMEKRKSKQPLEYPSAGSTFKRPENGYAAALIEQSGLKGFHVGDAMVSPKHSGFIINTGNASANDVKELIRQVQKIVFEKTNTHLQCEIKMIGEE